MNGMPGFGPKSFIAASVFSLVVTAAAAREETPIILSPEQAAGAFQESPISAEPIVFHFEDRSRTRVGKLTFLGGLELKSDDSRFGGLSSLQMSADGSQFLAITDHGYWVGGLLDRDAEDKLTGLRNVVIAPLLGLNGRPLAEVSKGAGDAEAIAEIPGSGIVVSFEGDGRLWHYGAGMTDFMRNVKPLPLPLPIDIVEEIESLPSNGGIEALTTLPGGSLVAIAEDSNKYDDLFTGWIISSTQIASFQYKATDGFRPTDLATLPDGNLLVLERRFSLLQGLAARIRKLQVADLLKEGPVEAEEIATMAFPYNIDNMEGLDVRENEKGETLVYLLSDNNFHPLQRTLFMSFRLED